MAGDQISSSSSQTPEPPSSSEGVSHQQQPRTPSSTTMNVHEIRQEFSSHTPSLQSSIPDPTFIADMPDALILFQSALSLRQISDKVLIIPGEEGLKLRSTSDCHSLQGTILLPKELFTYYMIDYSLLDNDMYIKADDLLDALRTNFEAGVAESSRLANEVKRKKIFIRLEFSIGVLKISADFVGAQLMSHLIPLEHDPVPDPPEGNPQSEIKVQTDYIVDVLEELELEGDRLGASFHQQGISFKTYHLGLDCVTTVQEGICEKVRCPDDAPPGPSSASYFHYPSLLFKLFMKTLINSYELSFAQWKDNGVLKITAKLKYVKGLDEEGVAPEFDYTQADFTLLCLVDEMDDLMEDEDNIFVN